MGIPARHRVIYRRKSIEGIGIFVSQYDGWDADNTCVGLEYEVEDGLVFHLSDESQLVIEASNMPLWLELWYGTKPISENAIRKKRAHVVFEEKPAEA